MIQEALSPVARLPFTNKDWDNLCSSLKHSLLVRTELTKLARDLGLKWPIKGKDETPERYICFTLEELADLPEFFGKGNRLALLYSILMETKQMDDPFTDMTRHLDHVTSEKAEGMLALRKLEVPEDFPVQLMNFSRRTLSICQEGGYTTVGELIDFLQTSASAAIINEEFREFLGLLLQLDTTGLARLLPIREGARGIFLAEGLGLIGRRLMDDQAATLIHAYRISTTRAEWSEDAVLPKTEALKLIDEVKESALRYFALVPEQAEELHRAIEAGMGSTMRYFVSLNDPDRESLAIAIAMAALDLKPKLKGLIGSFWS